MADVADVVIAAIEQRILAPEPLRDLLRHRLGKTRSDPEGDGGCEVDG